MYFFCVTIYMPSVFCRWEAAFVNVNLTESELWHIAEYTQMAENLEQCFRKALLKHLPEDEGDSDGDSWIRIDNREKPFKRRSQARRSKVGGWRKSKLESGRKRQSSESSLVHQSSPSEDGEDHLPPTTNKSAKGQSYTHPLHYGGTQRPPFYPVDMVSGGTLRFQYFHLSVPI